MSGPIDPKEIMRGIRASVRGGANDASGENVEEQLAFLAENADTDFERQITTHRGGFGKLYLRFRKWIYREHRLSVGPVIEKQTQFNKAVGQVLVSQQQRIVELEQRIAELETSSGGKKPGASSE